MKRHKARLGLSVVIGVAMIFLVTVTLYAASSVSTDREPSVEATSAHIHPLATETGWNSGWFALTPGATQVFTHDLGGDVGDYAVELLFWDTEAGGLGVHTFGYGGFEESGNWEGGYWSDFTTTNITVHRMANDETADRMRVRVWFMTPPDYDSGWQVITPTLPLTLTHNLGGDSEDYTLGLWFQDTTLDGYGIHNRYFGSVEHGAQYEGAHWQNLNETNIVVRRWADDVDVDKVRVRIIKTPPEPDYDSDWQTITAGETLTLTHNLGGLAGRYRVSLEYQDTSGLPNSFGRNMLWAGGEAVGSNHFGGHWQRLTNSTVQVYRQPGGTRDTEVRVRIWTPKVIYLPLITSD